MAKKHSKRIWYIGLTKDEADLAFLNRRLPIGVRLFDQFSLAFGLASFKRLKPVRDKAGQLVLDEHGYAKLPEPGRITVIGVKGKSLDWKQIEKGEKLPSQTIGIKGDYIEVDYQVALNKQTLDVVLEETDESYESYITSPLVQAGQHMMKQTASKVVQELKSDATPTSEELISTP